MSWTIIILCPIELALYLGGGTISLSWIILEILVVNSSFCRLRVSWTILILCPIKLALYVYLGGGTISLSRIILEILVVNGSLARSAEKWTILILCPKNFTRSCHEIFGVITHLVEIQNLHETNFSPLFCQYTRLFVTAEMLDAHNHTPNSWFSTLESG